MPETITTTATVAPHETPDYVEAAMAAERAVGLREAMVLIRQGRLGYAHFKLARSVERQARIAGIGGVYLAASTQIIGGGRS